MAAKTEAPRTADFLLSAANGTYSLEDIIVSGGTYETGTVLGQVTSTGKYVILAPAADDGSQNAAAVLWSRTDASARDVIAFGIVRAAEVKSAILIWPAGISGPQKTAAIDQLNALGIVLR